MKLKFLIIYKKSAYKHYVIDRRRSQRSLKLRPGTAARFARTHLQHYASLADIEAELKRREIPYQKSPRGRLRDLKGANVVITIGGDGTFLEASRLVSDELIVGINSDPVWSVGKFCTASRETFPHLLDALLTGSYRVRPLARMSFKMKGVKSINVLNDVLICHKNPAAMSRYCLVFRKHREEQRSSGIWIATAAGSTGAIRSAGGKVLSLTSRQRQYKVRELYEHRARRYHVTGGVIRSAESLKVISLMQGGMAYIDGSHLSYPFNMGSDIVLGPSAHPLRTVIV